MRVARYQPGDRVYLLVNRKKVIGTVKKVIYVGINTVYSVQTAKYYFPTLPASRLRLVSGRRK